MSAAPHAARSAGAPGAARAKAPAADRALAALVAAWAVASLLPLGAWTGVVGNPLLYPDAWRLWGRLALGTAALVGAAVALGGRRPAAAVRAAVGRALAVPRAPFLAALGALAFVEAAALAGIGFGRNPPTLDTAVAWFQAGIFAAGRLVADPPESYAHFAVLNAVADARGWYGQYPPVHPALVAVGLLLGAPWLVTPALAACLPAVVHRLGRETGDERVARLAAALVPLSPFAVVMGASGLSHVPAALAVGTGLAAAAGAARGHVPSGALLGAATGLAFGLRPLDAAVLAAVGAAALAAAVLRGAGLRVVAATAGAGAAALVPTLVYNAATTGNPLVYAYTRIWTGADGLPIGLGVTVPFGESPTFWRSLGRTALDGHELNLYLLGWAVPVTALAAAALVAPRTPLPAALRASAAYLVGLVAAFFFVFFRDSFGGPRYVFSVVPGVLVLVAAGIVRLADLARPVDRRGTTAGDVAALAVAAGALASAVLILPQHLASFDRRGTVGATDAVAAARAAGLERAVIFVPDGWGARLVARLWALGVPVARSPALYRAFDACTLQTLLDDAEAAGLRGAALVARLEAAAATAAPGVPALDATPDPMTRLPADRTRLGPRCHAELARDRNGIVEYAPFLRLNGPRLDADLVWARELGPADATLARRWPDRPRWRWAPGPDGRMAFTPLGR